MFTFSMQFNSSDDENVARLLLTSRLLIRDLLKRLKRNTYTYTLPSLKVESVQAHFVRPQQPTFHNTTTTGAHIQIEHRDHINETYGQPNVRCVERRGLALVKQFNS